MEFFLNGIKVKFPNAITISALLKNLEIEVDKVAVERNLEIVDSAAFASTKIMDDDRIEIVQFVGGG